MEYLTYGQIRDKVERDLDLEEEQFIQPTEMLGYCNEAIDDVEAKIHTLYEDYFLANSPLPITTGTSDYDLPSGIYANKIRDVVYAKGVLIYPIKRLPLINKFVIGAEINQQNTSLYYRYQLHNPAGGKPKLRLYPPAKEDHSTAVTIWYIRNAARMVDDNSICDIPEFVNYVIQHMKVRCYEKEGHPNLPKALADLKRLEDLMIETLSTMVPDNDNEVEPDLGHYEEHS